MKKLFLSILLITICSFLFAQTKTIKSDKGQAKFENDDIWIGAVLVNDLKSTINEWNSIPENAAPKILSTTKASLDNNLIVPFIIYKLNTEEISSMYYDCELVKPDGSKSKSKGSKLVFWKSKPQNINLFYSVVQNCGWSLDETDPEGEYIIKIKAYSDKKEITEFQLSFTFTK